MKTRFWISILAGAATLGLTMTTTGFATEQRKAANADALHLSAQAATDISAARRRRTRYNANASMPRGLPPGPPPVYTRAPDQANPYYGTSTNFGYGVGDNSHNVIN